MMIITLLTIMFVSALVVYALLKDEKQEDIKISIALITYPTDEEMDMAEAHWNALWYVGDDECSIMGTYSGTHESMHLGHGKRFYNGTTHHAGDRTRR